jgi:TatD DNase family protein
MSIYIDHHTHSKRCIDSTIEVISLHDNQQKEKLYFTKGFHPWWTETLLSVEQLNSLSQAYNNQNNCLAIGECGLDNLKGAKLDLQEQIFLQQVAVANECNAPVVVHCVRAYDRIIRLRKEYGNTDWVVHGFVRNAVLAEQLLNAGFHLSLAPYEGMKDSFIETINYVPLDRIFIETDSSTMHNISERYAIFAALRCLEIEELKEIIFENFKRFYEKKWKYLNG